MDILKQKENVTNIVTHQLNAYWPDVDRAIIEDAIPDALVAMEENFFGLPNKRFFDGERSVFSPYVSVQWMIFLYRLSRAVFLRSQGKAKEADQLYYLNKIMHANDWLYEIELPKHFLCEHPLGSVLGRASYGDYLFVYQGTTIGGNRGAKLMYPTLGNNVILFANATVIGDTQIGDNVIISAESYLKNEVIPDNSIVFGKTPNVVIKQKSKSEILRYTQHIWGWR